MSQQEEVKEERVGSKVETLDQSPRSSTSDPSLSRNLSSSKLNARAAEFVPNRPPPVAVAPPPPPPPPPPPMMHIFPPPPPPPFHMPIHMIPFHHQRHQQYVPVRNHNGNNGGSNLQYLPVMNHQSQNQNHQFHGSGSGGKKGAIEEDAEVVSKNNDHIQKLLNQVEYYFSDLNLATTEHLMRFITKDPEGYVPISVVASFKKVKAAINNNSQLATILRNSTKLMVSEDGKKVKRVHPFTESDVEELQSRIVVAENLPEDHCHQNLMKIFSAVGSVKTIRTCPPQTCGGGAASASRSVKHDGMHYSNKLHAFVEYETVEMAEKAVVELNDEGNWRSGLRVRVMLKCNSKPNQARGKKTHDGQGYPEEDEVSTSEQLNEKQMEDLAPQPEVVSHEPSGEDHANERENAQRKGRAKGRGKGRGRSQHHHSNRGSQVGTPPANSMAVNEQPGLAKQPPGPRMPDGTRGFAMGRGKPVAINVS